MRFLKEDGTLEQIHIYQAFPLGTSQLTQSTGEQSSDGKQQSHWAEETRGREPEVAEAATGKFQKEKEDKEKKFPNMHRNLLQILS